jgi:hypothetical protein
MLLTDTTGHQIAGHEVELVKQLLDRWFRVTTVVVPSEATLVRWYRTREDALRGYRARAEHRGPWWGFADNDYAAAGIHDPDEPDRSNLVVRFTLDDLGDYAEHADHLVDAIPDPDGQDPSGFMYRGEVGLLFELGTSIYE